MVVDLKKKHYEEGLQGVDLYIREFELKAESIMIAVQEVALQN